MKRPKSILRVCLSACLGALAFASLQASATVIQYSTPSGASVGDGPVIANATFTTSTNLLTIVLTDLLINPKSVGQLISDLDFVLSGGQTTGTLSSSSGQQITVAGNGSFVLGSTGTTGWGLNNNVAGGLQLDALGFIGPAGLLIGPPGGATYAAANSSIAGNGPHNPFLNQTATFNIAIAGLSDTSTVTSATFSFGTTPGINVPGIPGPPSPPRVTPEPASIALLGIGLLAFAGSRRSRKS